MRYPQPLQAHTSSALFQLSMSIKWDAFFLSEKYRGIIPTVIIRYRCNGCPARTKNVCTFPQAPLRTHTRVHLGREHPLTLLKLNSIKTITLSFHALFGHTLSMKILGLFTPMGYIINLIATRQMQLTNKMISDP